jgi:hypothetical protein
MSIRLPLKKLRKRLILVTLVAANVALIFYLMFRGSIDARPKLAVNSIPAVDIVDDTGIRRNLTSLIGRPVVLQFINPEASNQVDSVSRMLTRFGAEISVVLITGDSNKLRERVPSLPHNAVVIQHDYAELKRIFEVPDCCERRFIYNDAGNLGYHDYYYDADLTPRLSELTPRPLPPVSSALLESIVSLPNGRISLAREMTRHTKSGKAVITMFASVRTNCPSGDLIRTLNHQAMKNPEVSFITILPKEYTTADLDNFKSNLGVRFAVETQDATLAKEFEKLVSSYGESRLNGVVLLIERGIVTVLDNPNDVELRLSQL